MSIRAIDRRQLLRRSVTLAATSMLAAPAIAQARTKLRLGYLHVVAVDGHIWTGLDRGSFDREGIDFELYEFSTGPEVFEAMTRGELDVASAGGVISNYLALGRGRGFLINDIEVATAQLWVRPSRGVSKLADLRGRRIATTAKTTAHIFLDRALRANHLAPSDVEIVSLRMSDSVASFIAGEVPAIALWVPFNVTVREKVPGAVKLVDAAAYYPQSAVRRLGCPQRLLRTEPGHPRRRDPRLGRGKRLHGAECRSRGRGAAEEPLRPGPAFRYRRAAQGAEDVHLARVEASLCRRQRRPMAAAGERLLHGRGQDFRCDAGIRVFRSEHLSIDGLAAACWRRTWHLLRRSHGWSAEARGTSGIDIISATGTMRIAH